MAKKKIEYEYIITLYEVILPANHSRIIPKVNDVEYAMHKHEAIYRALHVTCDDLLLTEYGRRFIGKFADMVRDNPKNKHDQYNNCFFIKKINELGRLSDVVVKAEQTNGYLNQEDRNVFFYLNRVGVLFIVENSLLNMLRDDANLEIYFKSRKFGKYDMLEPKFNIDTFTNNIPRPRFILIQKVEKE